MIRASDGFGKFTSDFDSWNFEKSHENRLIFYKVLKALNGNIEKKWNIAKINYKFII